MCVDMSVGAEMDMNLIVRVSVDSHVHVHVDIHVHARARACPIPERLVGLRVGERQLGDDAAAQLELHARQVGVGGQKCAAP